MTSQQKWYELDGAHGEFWFHYLVTCDECQDCHYEHLNRDVLDDIDNVLSDMLEDSTGSRWTCEGGTMLSASEVLDEITMTAWNKHVSKLPDMFDPKTYMRYSRWEKWSMFTSRLD